MTKNVFFVPVYERVALGWHDTTHARADRVQLQEALTSYEQPDARLERIDLLRELRNALKTLPARERSMLLLFCGWGPPERRQQTIRQIAELSDVGRQRVRQLITRAVRELQDAAKHPAFHSAAACLWCERKATPPFRHPGHPYPIIVFEETWQRPAKAVS